MKIVEGIAPESGACLLEVKIYVPSTPTPTYFFQASRYVVNWKKSFFGTHYDDLRAIKQKYDPQSLFLVYKGVASDEWEADLICRV